MTKNSKKRSKLVKSILKGEIAMLAIALALCLTTLIPTKVIGKASLSQIERDEIAHDNPLVKLSEPLILIQENVKNDDEFRRRLYEIRKEQITAREYAKPTLAEVSSTIEKEETAMEEKQEKSNPLLLKNMPSEYRTWRIGYTTAQLNVRSGPSTDCKKIGTLRWNQPVKYRKVSDDWGVCKYKDDCGYISLKYISEEEIESYTQDTIYEQQKSWMDYRTITDTSSPQWKLEHGADAYTGNYGIRMIDGRYLCAVGSYYSHDVGRYVDLILEDGTVIPCILGDQKDDGDTDESNMYTEHDHSVVEFVVDLDEVPSKVKISGNYCSIPEWSSSIKEIRIYRYNPYSEL